MATAKPAAKPAADTDTAGAAPATSETETTTEKTPDDLTEKIRAVVKEVLGDLSPKGEAKTEPDPESAKPLTAREEETRTHNIVAEAIAAFKEELVGQKSEKPQPAHKEAETVPGSSSVRKIEKLLWGAR